MRVPLRLALVVAASLLASCSHDPTEVVVVVDGELAIPGEVDTIDFTVTAPNGETRTATSPLVAGDTFPRTLGLVKGSGPDGSYVVDVTALHGGATVLARRARFQFASGHIRMIRVDLLRACRFVSCFNGTTCGEGGFCERPDVPLEPWNGSPASHFDGGTASTLRMVVP